jgi:hypothetical protein
LAQTIGGHIDQQLRQQAEGARALGALEDQIRIRLATDLLPVLDALQVGIIATRGLIAADRQASANRNEGIKISASPRALTASEKASRRVKLAALDRRLEREADAVLHRSERLMLQLEADGHVARAEEVLALAGDLERARQDRDDDRVCALTETLSEVIYSLQD